MPIETACPNCNSQTTQRVTMLVASGTTVRKTQGAAMGASRRRSAGGVYGSTTLTKSALVAKFAPPRRPVGIHYILAIGLGGVLCLFVVGALVGIPLIIWGVKQVKRMPARVEAWNAAMVRFNTLWVCKKCGHEWIPEATEEVPAAV